MKFLVFREKEGELRVYYQVFNFVDIVFYTLAVQLKTEFEVLVIEDSNVGLRVVIENFDDSRIIDQIVFKKFRVVYCILENLSESGCLKVAKGFSVLEDNFDHDY